MPRSRRLGVVLVAWLAMTTTVSAQVAASVDAAVAPAAAVAPDYRPPLLVTDVVLSGTQASNCVPVGRSIQLQLREELAEARFRIIVDASIPAPQRHGFLFGAEGDDFVLRVIGATALGRAGR